MGRRAQRVSYEDKLEISEMALASKSDPQIAKAMDRSVHTIRKWRRQFVKYGKTGLTIKMGRPASGVLGSYPEELRTHCKNDIIDNYAPKRSSTSSSLSRGPTMVTRSPSWNWVKPRDIKICPSR